MARKFIENEEVDFDTFLVLYEEVSGDKVEYGTALRRAFHHNIYNVCPAESLDKAKENFKDSLETWRVKL